MLKEQRIPVPVTEKLVIPENNKIVSYIIPVYNMELTIENTIKSCLQQQYPYKEIIVVDDGSTDKTAQIVQQFPEVKYIYQDNMGTAQALNSGIKESIGEYLTWISADDYYIDPTATTQRVILLENNSELDFVYAGFYDVINNQRNLYHVVSFDTKEEAYEYNKKTCLINGSTLLMRRKVIYNIGLFNYAYRWRQDYDYWFRLTKFHKGIGIDKPLIDRTNIVNMMAGELVDVNGYGRKAFNLELEMLLKHARMWEITNRPKITAMICMKNEDELIEHCIDDLIQWVDDIVVFNDGSTDNSPYRIMKYPKVREIYNQPYKGNVRTESLDRQKLLEMAQVQKTEWIIFIDTDEVFEHFMKYNVYDLITNPNDNVYSFLELNFWRSYTHYRTDELWLKGWFKRLFRNKEGLSIYNLNEHCGGVPYNLTGEIIKVPDIRVKHYGFAQWERNVTRYRRRMERDPYNVETGQGGAERYDRMLNEEGLILKPYEGDTIRSLITKKGK